jgi:predicted nuclease with TOPRIM domain
MASMQADIVKALESGNQALKKIQAEVSVDYVSKLMDENAELQSEVTEIGQMLSSVQTEDPELFDEYQKLEAQVALDKISEVPNVPNSSLPEGMTQQATEGDTMTNRQEVFTESSESIEESVAVAAE